MIEKVNESVENYNKIIQTITFQLLMLHAVMNNFTRKKSKLLFNLNTFSNTLIYYIYTM